MDRQSQQYPSYNATKSEQVFSIDIEKVKYE